MAILENRDGACVAPIVDDVLEYVRFAATRHLQEKSAADCFSALRKADRLDALLRSLGHMGDVEEDSPQSGVCLQDGLKEHAVPTPHVDNRAELREVVRGGNCDSDSLREIRHGLVEVRGLFRVLCHVGKGIHAKYMMKCRLAGPHAVKHVAPSLLCDACKQERCRTHRSWHAGSQAFSERSQRKAAIVLLGKHSDACQEAQHSCE